MNFRQIHFCAERIVEDYISLNWVEELAESPEVTLDYKNRRLGLFKNILISQNIGYKSRPNKWKKHKSGPWNLTHQAGKGADKEGNYSKENGYSIEFLQNQDDLPVIRLLSDDNTNVELAFQENWERIALDDFDNGRREFLKDNSNKNFVTTRTTYELYIRFISSLFSKLNNNKLDDENPLEPYHKTYLGLFQSYKQKGISEKTKAVIETTMGAMIFYMPQNAERSWSGKISYSCFLNCLANRKYKKVKDHEIPRKLSAKICLDREDPFTLNEFEERYWNQFSSFTYVTTEENMDLINWYLDDNNITADGQYNYSNALINLDIKYYSFPRNFSHKKINRIINAVGKDYQIGNLNGTHELENIIDHYCEF